MTPLMKNESYQSIIKSQNRQSTLEENKAVFTTVGGRNTWLSLVFSLFKFFEQAVTCLSVAGLNKD